MDQPPPDLSPRPVTAGTLLRYLAFDEDAIRRIAAAPRVILAGAVLVVAAGLARDYDGEDLLAEPWHLAGGLAISTVVSTLMAGLLWLQAVRSPERPPFRMVWPRFVGLFWLTAPMAWLYAVPWERVAEPLTATKLNLWTLLLVSVWRVALTTKVGAVLFGLPKRAAVWAVLLVSSAVMLYASTKLPVIQIMGGVRRSPSEDFLAVTGFLLGAGSGLTLFVSFFAYAATVGRKIVAGGPRTSLAGGSLRRSAWVFAAASVVVGLCLLPVGQGEQRNRTRFESLVREGNHAAAADFAASLNQGDFPPHWEPIPERAFGERAVTRTRFDFLAAAGPTAPPWLVRRVMDLAIPRYYGRVWSSSLPENPERLRKDFAALLSLPWTEDEWRAIRDNVAMPGWSAERKAVVTEVLAEFDRESATPETAAGLEADAGD